MNIAELRDAAEKHIKLCRDNSVDPGPVALFAEKLISTDPITPEWLREKWGFKINYVRCAKVLITDAIGIEHPLHWYGFNRFSVRGMPIDMNQGQFTALMFSLGHFPKETP